mmetsp:Transcript_544/g.1682  ORF Transcript_544/g.1682 Transcript_544/m.1682 type:complete len:645 (+) Transcript_544:79-2013(+)
MPSPPPLQHVVRDEPSSAAIPDKPVSSHESTSYEFVTGLVTDSPISPDGESVCEIKALEDDDLKWNSFEALDLSGAYVASPRKIVPRLYPPGQSKMVHPIFSRTNSLGEVKQSLDVLCERLSRLEKRLEVWNATASGKRRRHARRRSANLGNGQAEANRASNARASGRSEISMATSAPYVSEGAVVEEPSKDVQKVASFPKQETVGRKTAKFEVGTRSRFKDLVQNMSTKSSSPSRAPSVCRPQPVQPVRQKGLRRLVSHPLFDNVVAGTIVVNAMFIAAQTEYVVQTAGRTHSKSADTGFNVVDKVFTGWFTLELILRMLGLRRDFFAAPGRGWNIFDMLLVVMSLVQQVIETAGSYSVVEMDESGATNVVRMIRMARVIRVMRVLRFLDELRTMLLLILHSMRSLFWLMVLLGIILFIFSIFFTQGVADVLQSTSADGLDPDVQTYYGSLAKSAFTLFMAITGGVSWRDVVDPLKYVGWGFTALFIMYVSFCVFSVLNIVTGVFVDGAIQRSAQERELRLEKEKDKKEVYLSMLHDLLNEIDTDGTGVISRIALEDAFQRERVRYTFSALDIDIPDSNYLFDMLDEDGSGEVEEAEFIDGCLRLKGNAKSIDIHTLMFEIKQLMKKWDGLFELELGHHDDAN